MGFLQSLLQRIPVVDQHKANPHWKILESILHVAQLLTLLHHFSESHPLLDQHRSLTQISILQTNRQRSVPLSVLNIVIPLLLEEIQNRKKEFLLTGVVQRCPLVNVFDVDVSIALSEKSL